MPRATIVACPRPILAGSILVVQRLWDKTVKNMSIPY